MGRSQFLQSIALPNEDMPASTQRAAFALGVNPLSMVFLRLQITNTNPSALLTYSAIDDAIGRVTNIKILRRGVAIVDGSLRDIAMLNAVRWGLFPGASWFNKTNGGVRTLVFPLCLGRAPFSKDSALPATQRGDLLMQFTAGANPAGLSDMNVSVEQVELIDATPSDYVKYTTIAATAVVGQFDVPLPIGNPYLGVLLFDTGITTLTTDVSSWGTVALLKDNVQQYFPTSDMPTLAGILASQMGNSFYLTGGHVHQINDGAALSQSDDAEMVSTQGPTGYGYLDFDPTRDGEYELDTVGAAALLIRGVGGSATAVRAMPLERVSVAK
jgi:hypothetical protein